MLRNARDQRTQAAEKTALSGLPVCLSAAVGRRATRSGR